MEIALINGEKSDCFHKSRATVQLIWKNILLCHSEEERRRIYYISSNRAFIFPVNPLGAKQRVLFQAKTFAPLRFVQDDYDGDECAE
ncbi:MAG: hypothetical protein JXR70_16495 [Spirochaetales bacterium]|nr:hypothetical protein [Spirochaetales bacterium]